MTAQNWLTPNYETFLKSFWRCPWG